VTIDRFPKSVAILVPSLGILLHAYISFFEASGGPNAFTLGLLAWSSLPYAICLLIAFAIDRPFLGFCGATVALLADLGTYYSVFVSPTSSAAAISVLFAPMVSLVVWVPVGVLVGFLLGRLKTRRAAP
jgi:hypothetical protein